MTANTETSRRFQSNTTWLIAGRFLVAGLGWAGTVLIVRQLDQVAFGYFTLVFSILGMLSIVTDLGVGRVAVGVLLDAGRDTDKAGFAGSYIVLRTALGLLGYAIALLVVFAAGYPTVVLTATATAGLVVVFATPSQAYDLAFQVRDELRPLAISKVLAQFAQFGLVIAVVLNGGGLVWLTVPAVANAFLQLVWKAPAAHRRTTFRYQINLATWKSLLHEAIPLTAGSAFLTLYYRVDSVMLSKLDTFEAVGRYGVAYKFVDLVHFVPSALAVALLAPLTASWQKNPERFSEMIVAGGRTLSLAAGLAVVGFWNFSTPLVGFLYGSEYEAAALAIKLVVTAECIGYFSSLIVVTLIASNTYRRYPFIAFVGLVLNVVSNLILIRRYSFEGAAIATLLTEAVVVCLLMSRFRALGFPMFPVAVVRRLPLIVLASLGAGWLFARTTPWLLGGLLTAVTYGLLIIVGGLAAPPSIRGRFREEVSK